MSARREKTATNQQDKEQQSQERRRRRMALFIQQFEKDAQERMRYLEAKLESMLATVDKIFKVELMKMPPSLQNTLMGDLICEEEASASEVSIAIRNESREMDQPFRLITSKRLKSSDSTPPVAQRPASKTPKGGRGAKGDSVLAGSSSTGTLISSSTTIKRTRSRLTNRKTQEQMNLRKPKLRSVVSAGELPCSMAGSAAHVTVTTAQGQMLSFSEDSKDDINLDLLDDVAWCQIQKLSKLMECLSRQSRCHR
ncbi:borealin-2 [Nothobranchius furzeri]|uniref:borealin-2 n=1 Tax=Nothobranchius furzeri TaxID=105023 RepID=UPI0024044410|nr:borealin-2 [Nothobranchius furzeri]